MSPPSEHCFPKDREGGQGERQMPTAGARGRGAELWRKRQVNARGQEQPGL